MDPESVPTSAIKETIERALVSEAAARVPEAPLSFTRIFNRDAPDFSRIFSRGGAILRELTVPEVVKMEDADFARFTERLRVLQDLAADYDRR